jgi:thiol-disulfide isomerase/thioredoxin
MHPKRGVRSIGRVLAGLCLFLAMGGLAHSAASASKDLFASLKVTRIAGAPESIPFDLKTLDGGTVRSQDLTGKVVLLNFWATWCGPCKEEMPSLARLTQRLDPQRFVVVTVTADLHPQGIKQFLAQLGIGLPVLFDDDQEVSRSFMVRGLPTTVLLAPDGRAVGRAVGPRDWDSPEAVALMQHVLKDTK